MAELTEPIDVLVVGGNAALVRGNAIQGNAIQGRC